MNIHLSLIINFPVSGSRLYLLKKFQMTTFRYTSAFLQAIHTQMSRILKDYTDKTFVTVIQDIKIEKARELLANPDISIQKIVDMVGYTSTSHFYTVFKKYYGMTPTAFRDASQLRPPISL